MILDHNSAMELAIEEGKKGWGWTAPNPAVGCVILDESGKLLVKSYHKKLGDLHAEANAINLVSDKSQLKNATLYVTLEPCAHEGKTPSCAHLLKQFPFKQIIYGLKDPNPLVSGKGVEILKKINIDAISFSEVSTDKNILKNIHELSEIFFWNIKHQECFIALKVATSIDGIMALNNGESKWITNEASRNYVQYLRGKYDSILVGRKTFEMDNPNLNIRHENFINKKNKVVILDPKAKSLSKIENSNLLKHHQPNDIFVITNAPHESDKFQIIPCKTKNNRFDLADLKKIFFENQIYSVFVEGGSFVYSEFLSQKAFNKIYHFTSSSIIGDGVSWTKGLKIGALEDQLILERSKTQSFGGDLLTTYGQHL
jgi:diaminohydroxyphosphoribosylaminopyrimidine deaminase/5-amino-6-(5-phosphoribosylamino)uracil reductase